MHPTPLDVALPLRQFTVEEWHQLIAAGVLGEDERVELVEGMVVTMTPQGKPHFIALNRLTKALYRSLGDEYSIRPQGPLTLGPTSEPEPDLAVVHAAAERAAKAHPTTALLVVEVSDSSRGLDRTVKLRLYARAAIPEFWIVDVAAKAVEVYRGPLAKSGRYRTRRVLASSETLRSSALPEVSLPVASLFD